MSDSVFLVRVSAACMPGSCWGTYKRVAVLECDPGVDTDNPPRIDVRAKGVRRIVRVWERVSWRGERLSSVSHRTLADARALAAALNGAGNDPIAPR